MSLEEIIYNSTFKVLPDSYCVAKINADFESSGIFMVSLDDIEATAIYKEGTAKKGVFEEKSGYRLIAVDVAIPFYAPGFIASITQRLGEKSISVLVVSTYSRDYFIVASKHIHQAINELQSLGIKEH